ncbi:MAG: hypothetical protein K5776_06675 [Lachnospiraceae bacterium]|nr:hypothetical protein [Lachnospiraceae bacterium]
MGFFKNLFKRKKNIEEESPLDFLESQIHDDEERRKYVSTAFLQMKEISSDIDNLRFEYNVITSYLNDCEEIDRLPEEIKLPIEDAANDILTIKSNKEKYYLDKPLMEDSEYEKYDKLSDEFDEVIKKLKDAEDFQHKIKSDLKKLDGERQAYNYRKHEMNSMMKNIVGVLIISSTAFVICIVSLLLLAVLLDLNVKLGFLLTVTIICVVYSFLFLKGNELRKESVKLDKTIVKIIQLQNSVKIRYVNNTNLLDYLYMKYNTDSSKELKAGFDVYVEEKHRREQYEQANRELPAAKRRLLGLLKNLPISDPVSWIHTPEALVNKNELVEIRHEMIQRRQKLREKIDESTKEAESMKDEIKEIIKRYPKYSLEIRSMMKDFEDDE